MKIPPIPLIPKPETPEGEAVVGFRWAGKPIGERHRIGGEPDWIQDADVPVCACEKSMSFYAQLDSLGDQVTIGDGGMVYVFICWDCLTTQSVLQSF